MSKAREPRVLQEGSWNDNEMWVNWEGGNEEVGGLEVIKKYCFVEAGRKGSHGLKTACLSKWLSSDEVCDNDKSRVRAWKLSGYVRVEQKVIIYVEAKELRDRVLAAQVTHIGSEFAKGKGKGQTPWSRWTGHGREGFWEERILAGEWSINTCIQLWDCCRGLRVSPQIQKMWISMSQGWGRNLAFMEALNWLESYSCGINVLMKDWLVEKIYVSVISSRSCLCSQSTRPMRYNHHYFIFIVAVNLLRKQD